MSGINVFKKLNRNAFNEKLLHRYLFERYYFGSLKQKKNLLPDKYKSSPINLIVPEAVQPDYRADLTIYFKDESSVGIPIEVKWDVSDFKKSNQIKYIQENDGFVVVLSKTKKTEVSGIPVIQINHKDFSNWVTENISRLSRETLIYQANSKSLLDQKQNWIVFVEGAKNGSGLTNFKRMLEKTDVTSPFGAFPKTYGRQDDTNQSL